MSENTFAEVDQAQSPNFINFIKSFGQQKSLWKQLPQSFKLQYNPNRRSIAEEIRWFQHQQEYINELTRNARPYIYYVYQETQKRHLPAELALIPMIESNYKPFKYSSTGAIGLWQMMPGTASGLGLTINWWYDGRRSIMDSTKAALNYLTYLHSYFGNWLLAIAAYDAGEGTIENAILYNRRRGRPTDFWSLQLPLETKFYVPKILALASILKAPNHYHLHLNPVPNKPYFESVPMNHQIDLYQIAKYSHVKLKMVRDLNPGFRRWATLPNQPYHILLPIENANLFLQHLYESKTKDIAWYHHEIQPGDSLSSLAHHYHTSIETLKKINNLVSNHLSIGHVLLIPYAYKGKADQLPTIHKQDANIAEDRIPGPQQIIHVVKSNDSLWKIAAKYNITPNDLRYWNKLSHRSPLHEGQKLVIWKKHYHHTLAANDYYHYHVQKGDTLSVIAKRFNVTLHSIKSSNHINGTLIRIGENLKIPKIKET